MISCCLYSSVNDPSTTGRFLPTGVSMVMLSVQEQTSISTSSNPILIRCLFIALSDSGCKTNNFYQYSSLKTVSALTTAAVRNQPTVLPAGWMLESTLDGAPIMGLLLFDRMIL